MTLLNPIMLIGLLVLAVPIMIHLLNRSRFRVEPFGGMMFLQRAMRVRARSIRLRNKTILFVRCLLLLLIVFALTRPVFAPKTTYTEHQPTTHIIILDASFSMRQMQGGRTAFSAALVAAREIVERLRPSDNIQIIWGCQQPQPLFKRPVYDTDFVLQELAALESCAGTIDVPQSMKQAFWSAGSSRLPRQQIYVLTDGQAYGWRAENQRVWRELGEQQAILRADPRVYILAPRPQENPPNIAVTTVRPRFPLSHIHRPAKFTADIKNEGATDRQITLQFRVDGIVETTRDLDIPPGTTSLDFDHRFTEPGPHHAEIALITPDVLPIDDRRAVAFQVLDSISVLVISGAEHENPWMDDAAVAVRALEAEGNGSDPGLFRVTAKPRTYLETVETEELDTYDVLILADLPSFSDYAVFVLERFVEHGGGLLVAAGPKATADAYDFLYKKGRGLLPARLISPRIYKDKFYQFTLIPEEKSGMYSLLGVQRRKNLEDTVATAFWDVKTEATATTMAEIGNAPFLLFQRYGQGRVALWTTTLNATWTNLPATPHYLPLIQSLTATLSANRQPPLNLRIGEPLTIEITMPARTQNSAAASAVELTRPDGRTESIAMDKVRGGRLTLPESSPPGLYSLRLPDGTIRHAALRVDPDESNLAPLPPERREMIASFCNVAFYETPERFQAGSQQQGRDIEYWQVVIGAALLLLCIESYMSWRFSR